MGRVKGRVTKVAAHTLVRANASLFAADFARNKAVLRKLHILDGAENARNLLAGEITSIMRQHAPKPAAQAATA